MPGKFIVKNGVSFEMPPYKEADPVLWFYLIEILFRKISDLSSKDKYDITLLALGSGKSFSLLHEIRDFIFGEESSPSREPYETLKAHVIMISLEPEIEKLAEKMKSGNLKPTGYLKLIKEKFGHPWKSNVDIKQIFTKYLPSSLRELVKIIEQESSLETIAASLDGVFESVLLPLVTTPSRNVLSKSDILPSVTTPSRNVLSERDKELAAKDAETKRTRTKKKRRRTQQNRKFLPKPIKPVSELPHGNMDWWYQRKETQNLPNIWKTLNYQTYLELRKPSFISHFRVS